MAAAPISENFPDRNIGSEEGAMHLYLGKSASTFMRDANIGYAGDIHDLRGIGSPALDAMFYFPC